VTKQQESVLLAAIMDVVSGLDLYTTLERIVASAVQLSHATYGALGILGNNNDVIEFIHVGMDKNQVAAIGATPRGRGVLGLLISHPEPVRLADLSKHPASFGFPPNHPPMNSFLGVPVRVRGSVFGNLYLTEKVPSGEFTLEDQELVSALAAAAGLAIENARLFAQTQQIAVYEDRDRIARDLHDLVIQRLFATGMSLEALARTQVLQDTEAAKIRTAVDDLDLTIKQIRQSIYALTSANSESVTLRRQVMHEVETYSHLLGATPSITFEGAVDALVTDRVADQVIAALRELLSNAMRHAKAKSLSVSVQILDNKLVLTVADDGVGIPETARQSGLNNLRIRAEAMGGTFDVAQRKPTGTKARWSVPVK
jgi:signal transduction histidine kinase